MSKDFEQAYKELAQNEIPDLWDRIEAGLKEKSAPEQKQEEIENVMVKKTTGKKKSAIPVHYMGMAAAVLGAAVGIPALLAISQVQRKSFSGGGADRVMESAYDTADAGAASEETCETAEEAAIEEAKAADITEGAEENGIQGKVDKLEKEEIKREEEDAGETEGASGETDVQKGSVTAGMDKENAGSSEVAKTEMAETESGLLQSSINDLETEKEFMEGEAFNLTVEVTKGMEIYDENDKTPLGTLFTAIIQKDTSGSFETGEQIEIFVPVYSSQFLAAGSLFQVEIVYESNEKYPFRLQLCQKVSEQ